ncbi:MAG: hypothetical protein ABEH35_08540 [Haloarculaceae archaeon]
MDDRDLFDVLLVATISALAYVETFGLASPRATLDELVSIFLGIDVRVYLVLAGLLGIMFISYLTVYLPRKDASRTIR